MLRKSIKIFFLLLSLMFPCSLKAQTTMDAIMKIQAVFDQLSGLKAQLTQVQSSLNIQTQLQNLSGTAFKDVMSQAGGAFDSSSKKGGEEQALVLLPSGMDASADDPEATQKWVEDNMTQVAEGATPEEIKAALDKFKEMQFVALTNAYGKAVATRKLVDDAMSKVEELRQDAESKESETDLQNEINKIVLMKLEQVNNKQLIASTLAQVEAALNLQTTTTATEEE